jgi:WXG100 family type VII secretion target
MANVNVTYDDMTSAANHLTAGKEDLIGKLNDLDAYIRNLVSSGFVTDAASVRFGETYGEFTQGTTQVVNGLDGLSQFLTTAAEQLSETDQALASNL